MLNKAQIIGRLGKEPERTASNAPAKFSLATTMKYTNKQGEKVENTQWHNIVAWGKLADIIMQYVTKGMLVYVEGRLETKKYEKDGITRYSTVIVAETMKMLSRGNKTENYDANEPIMTTAGTDDEINVEDIPF